MSIVRSSPGIYSVLCAQFFLFFSHPSPCSFLSSPTLSSPFTRLSIEIMTSTNREQRPRRIWLGLVIGLAAITIVVWGWDSLRVSTPNTLSTMSMPASRIMARHLQSEGPGPLPENPRDPENVFSVTDLAVSELSELDAKYNGTCTSSQGCDLAFVCENSLCTRGCRKDDDCAGEQVCHWGQCHLHHTECLPYDQPCMHHKQ